MFFEQDKEVVFIDYIISYGEKLAKICGRGKFVLMLATKNPKVEDIGDWEK